MSSTPHVHVIGGGVVGLCTAYYLREEGFAVTVVDRHAVAQGASHGNAGMVVPSHIVPMAAPGVIRQGLRWMLDASSPFYIRPRLNLDLARWLWAFRRSATEAHVARSIPVLYGLNDLSKTLYRELAGQLDFGFAERGLLMLYKTAAAAREEAHLARRARDVGMAAEVLDAAGVQALEPDLALDILGGVYFPADAHLSPGVFLSALAGHLREDGVRFLAGREVVNLRAEGLRVRALELSDGEAVPVDQVVLAGGSWSAELLRRVGIRLLLQDGKGYSLTLRRPGVRPRIPTILAEAKVAVTPMGEDLRVGGTLEISGLSPKLNPRRIRSIAAAVPRYYRNVTVEYSDDTPVWTGYRPCSPDGLPYIGRTAALDNLVVGTGHGMMGLSLGPVTGKLISELVGERATSLGVEALSVGRF